MPSHLHEVLVEMFRDRPSLVADVLSGPLGVDLPQFGQARVSAGELTDVAPTEYRADIVITLTDLETDTPVMAVVVEVQLSAVSRPCWPLDVVDRDHAGLYADVVLAALAKAARATWRDA